MKAPDRRRWGAFFVSPVNKGGRPRPAPTLAPVPSREETNFYNQASRLCLHAVLRTRKLRIYLGIIQYRGERLTVCPQVTSGQVIFRQWAKSAGLHEITQRFESMNDLFASYLQVKDPKPVDRIIIDGRDGQGRPRVVTLTFQSMTISNAKAKPGE